MGLFSSSKKKADLPPEKKHCATIVDLAATDAEQGSEWKFEKSKFDVDGYFDKSYIDSNNDSIPILNRDEDKALLSLSTAMNKNIFTLGKILRSLTDKVDRVLAQNMELRERCITLEEEVKILKR